MQSSTFFETKKCNIVCILQLYCIEVQSVRNILQNNSEQEWIPIHFRWLVDKLYTECIVFMYVRITCNKKMKLTKIDCNIYLHDNYHDLFLEISMWKENKYYDSIDFFFRLNGNCITAMK